MQPTGLANPKLAHDVLDGVFVRKLDIIFIKIIVSVQHSHQLLPAPTPAKWWDCWVSKVKVCIFFAACANQTATPTQALPSIFWTNRHLTFTMIRGGFYPRGSHLNLFSDSIHHPPSHLLLDHTSKWRNCMLISRSESMSPPLLVGYVWVQHGAQIYGSLLKMKIAAGDKREGVSGQGKGE